MPPRPPGPGDESVGAQSSAWGNAGAHLVGAATYAGWATYWPSASGPFAKPMNEIPKVVFSNSLASADWDETTIAAGDLAGAVTRLKRERSGYLLAHGGGRFARSLAAALPSGSYLALSQIAADIEPEQMAEAARRYNRLAYDKQRHRSHAEVSRFFDGLELVAPVWSPCRIGGRPARLRAERNRLCGAAWGASAERRPRGTRMKPPTRP